MNEAILIMLDRYKPKSAQDYENALKEIIQEIALLGLWRSKFFEKAAFYGGSALRILYQLDRFSEDLDFSLLRTDKGFNISKYCKEIESEIRGFGFKVSVEKKEKTQKSQIESGFIKANTIENMISISAPDILLRKFHKERNLKIKIEVDINPPMGFETESRFLLQPMPFSVNTFKLNDIFAGKLHCILCREWKDRVKGRDWYDFVWFIGRNISLRLLHLEKRMKQSGHLEQNISLTLERLRAILKGRIEKTDFNEAIKDVYPFLKDPDSIKVWSRDFFVDLIWRLKADVQTEV